MKKATMSISYDEEKLSALRLYLEQKNQTLENELIAAADTLYAKSVPANVREFIDLRAGFGKPTEKKKKPKPPAIVESVRDRSEDI